MLSANKEKISSFFTGSNQFKIPFFQRAYVWKEDNWNELWENIKEEMNEIGPNGEHFIGTIIIKQIDTEKLGALIYDLIDGQQRLTTICLLLRALHDYSTDSNFKNWIYNLLVFTDSYGQKNIRILHSRIDRQYFLQIILSDDNNNRLEKANNKIVEAYFFFKDCIKRDVKEDQIRNIVTIVLERLPVIHMALSKTDDIQQIFDTINSLGVKLTTGELLKNHLFSLNGMEEKYEELWQSVFESDEDAVLFWNKDKTAGRIIRSTIELFLYSHLVIITGGIIKIESLFKEYKKYLNSKTSDEINKFAIELKDYALLYQQLPDGEQLAELSFAEHEKRFFHVMNELDITTVLPLVLFIYKIIKDIDERLKILSILESYLVRRTVCKLTTKNYNNLFISIILDLKGHGAFTSDDLKKLLLSYDEDSNRFPDDKEFSVSFLTNHLTNQYAKEILYCLALYHLGHDYQDKHTLNNSGLSVEHIMPKKWRNNWTLSSGVKEETRDSLLLTLGNLTLVKGKLNSKMRDDAWREKKKSLMAFSTLKITTDYLGYDEWNESVIVNRANNIYKDALKIWTR